LSSPLLAATVVVGAAVVLGEPDSVGWQPRRSSEPTQMEAAVLSSDRDIKSSWPLVK
jgi:hypothetical protein